MSLTNEEREAIILKTHNITQEQSDSPHDYDKKFNELKSLYHPNFRYNLEFNVASENMKELDRDGFLDLLTRIEVVQKESTLSITKDLFMERMIQYFQPILM